MTTDRLPADTDAEREIIVALLNYQPCAEAGATLLEERYFLDPVFAAMAGEIIRQQRGGGVDLEVLKKNLSGNRVFNDGSLGLVDELAGSYTTRHLFPNNCAAVVEAYRKRQRIIGFDELLHAARNGSTTDEIDRQALATFNRWQSDAAEFGRRERFTLCDLVERYPRQKPPVLDGLMRQGETANVISVTKVGKSWMMYGLALCEITRRPWLDRFNTSGGRVLLVDNELHASTLAHRIPAVADAMGIHRDEYDQKLEVWPLRGRLRSLSELALDFESLDPDAFSIIILDAKYRFALEGASENDNASEARFYNEIDRLAERTGAAIMLVHHSTKGSQSDKRITDVGAGAGAQSRAADCHLVLREHEDDGVCVLDAALRSFPPIEPMALRWCFPLWLPADGVDPARLKRPPSASEQRQAAREKEVADKIMAALLKDEATVRMIREKTGLSRERIESGLDRLSAAGHVTYTETTKRGNPCRVYRLCDHP
jgi:hypothetical protein